MDTCIIFFLAVKVYLSGWFPFLYLIPHKSFMNHKKYKKLKKIILIKLCHQSQSLSNPKPNRYITLEFFVSSKGNIVIHTPISIVTGTSTNFWWGKKVKQKSLKLLKWFKSHHFLHPQLSWNEEGHVRNKTNWKESAHAYEGVPSNILLCYKDKKKQLIWGFYLTPVTTL